MQPDLFRSTSEDYLYGEFQKTKTTVDELKKSMHANLAEMYEMIIVLKEQVEKGSKIQ